MPPPEDSERYQTAIGGIKALMLLNFAETAFKGYPSHRYFNNDFGPCGNGFVIDGPGGPISLPSTAR